MRKLIVIGLTALTLSAAPVIHAVHETITGRITMVNPEQKLVVIETSSEVPYDLKVPPETLIRYGNRVLPLTEMSPYQGLNATVRFEAHHRGGVAELIQIQELG